MAAFLVRALELTATSGITFSDVPPANAFAKDIDRLATAGITSGCGNGRFCPNDAVTRGQMAAFLQRALDLTPITPPPAAIRATRTGNVPIPPRRGWPIRPTLTTWSAPGPRRAARGGGRRRGRQGRGHHVRLRPDPVTIALTATAKVFNDRPDVVIDGGGKVTLERRRAPDPLHEHLRPGAGLDDRRTAGPGPPDADRAEHDASPTATPTGDRRRRTAAARSSCAAAGSRSSSSRFFGNRCARPGPTSAAPRCRSSRSTTAGRCIVVNSTFGGTRRQRQPCSNGGAHHSIGVSWTILNSLFRDNHAIGTGANPPSGTPGGGNGGAIYNDGNTMALHVLGTRIEDNTSNHEGGSAIFFVSNDRSRHGRDRRTRSCATTPVTGSRPTRASSSWAGRSRSPTRRSSSDGAARGPRPAGSEGLHGVARSVPWYLSAPTP